MLHIDRASPVLSLCLILGCAQPSDEAPRRAGSADPGRTEIAAARPEAKPSAKDELAAPSRAATDTPATAKAGSTPPSSTAPEPIPADPIPPATAQLLQTLSPAAKSATQPAPLPLTFELRKDQIWVSDGERAAPMNIHAESVGTTTSRTLDDGGVEVTLNYTDEVRCDGPELRRTYGADALRSRLEGTAAYRRHRAGAYDEAARGFALAATLDPAPDKRWSNLACALSRGGEIDKAILALQPLLARNPLAAYAKVVSDPDLRPLRERPELTGLRTKTPGRAELSLDKSGLQLQGFAFASAAKLRTVARLERSDSGGTCQFRIDLGFYSIEGDERLRLPLVHMQETEEMCGLDAEGAPPSIEKEHSAAVEGRLKHANRLLRDLGFESSPDLDRVVLDSQDELTLPTSKLRVLIGDDTITVLRGESLLNTAPRGHTTWLGAVGYDPLTEVAFVEWGNDLPEGCATDLAPAGTLVIPVGQT